MASRKTAAEAVDVVETVEVAAEEVAVEPVTVPEVAPPAPGTQEGVNPLLLQPRKKGTPNNTWRLYYGNLTFDNVQGVEREYPEDVYNYLKRHGNLIPPNF